MKGLKKKLRRGLAGFLSFVLTMTSFNMVSWADVAAAFEKENATFVMSGEDLRDSAQAAIDNGDEFNFEDLGVDTSDRSLAKEYQRLFETGSVFEFAPAYDMDEEEYADGAELRMFIRINGDPEGYQITGDEDIIFLYINDSDARVTFRSRIDGYTTQKVTVKGNSTLLDAEAPTAPVGGEGNGNGAGGAGANGGAGSEVQNPDGNAGGEDGAVDGTVQNPDGNANMGEAADGNGTTNGDVQNPDANAGGAIDGEGAASGDVQNPDAGLDGENGNAADDVQNPDANVSDGNGTNDGTVQNPAANADGENTDHSNTNTGKEEQVQKPEDHAGTNGGVQNSDTNKTEDGGKAEAGNSESGSSNSGAASDGGASNSGSSDGGDSNSGASNSGASDSGSSNSGASDSGSSDSGSDQGDSLVSAATLNRHYTHILTTAVNGDAGSKESDKVSSDEGKEDKVDAADKTDKADNTDTSDKHDSEDVNSDTNTEDGSNGGNADKDAVVTPDGEEGNSAVEDNKADDQGEVSKPDDGQGDAVIDDNSDKDNADKDNADKNAAEDNKADDTTVDGKDHAANGEDGKKNDSLVVDPEADEKEEVSKTGTTSGKTYGQVVLDESYYAKAYVTTLNKLHIDVSKEGYAVTYTVTPVGTAAVKGAKNVEEGKDLTFTVKPQVGYVIDHVTANGESLEAVEDDEATASNADTGVKRFVVPEIEEEQEIVVVMAEIGEHPEFNFSKTLGDVVVSLHAEEGILPAGTVAKVTEVTEKVEEAVKEKTAEETGEDTSANTILAYDIKLFVENEAGELEALDNSWSENGYVEVTFAGKAIEEKSAEAESIEIAYIDTGNVDVVSGEVEKIVSEEVQSMEAVAESVSVSGDNSVEKVSFEAEHFSIYAIRFTNDKVAIKIITVDPSGKQIGNKNYDNNKAYRYTFTNGELSRSVSDIAKNIKNTEASAFAAYVFDKATIGKDYENGITIQMIRQKSLLDKTLQYSTGNQGWGNLSNKDYIYFWYKPVTVTFDPNTMYGGVGQPFTVTVGEEGKITTPQNQFTNRYGYEFAGWHGQKSGHHSGAEMLQQTFIEGVQYPPSLSENNERITDNITLYATWVNPNGNDGKEAYFYIRTDGKAPFEPNGYGASAYYPAANSATQLKGTLRNKIEVNNDTEMVAANILKEPTGTDIAKAAEAAGKTFDPNTQKVIWYVIKEQSDWHVDGIVVDKNTYSVRYWPNGGTENVPPAENYSEGTKVNVNFNNIPTRVGYDFLGWDTDKTAELPQYKKDGKNNSFVIKDSDVDLYAVWEPKAGTRVTVEHYQQSLDGSYPEDATEIEYKKAVTDSVVRDDDYQKFYGGFKYISGEVDEVTEAKVEGDGSTVLRLYYQRNQRTPYTVEHYKQSIENPGKYTLAYHEDLFGMTGAEAEFTPRDYTADGYNYNESLTTPAEKIITGDEKLVIKLYYDAAKVELSTWYYDIAKPFVNEEGIVILDDRLTEPSANKVLLSGSNFPYTEEEIETMADNMLQRYFKLNHDVRDFKYDHFEVYSVQNGWNMLYDSSSGSGNLSDIKMTSGYDYRIHICYEAARPVTVRYFKCDADGSNPKMIGDAVEIPLMFVGDQLLIAPTGNGKFIDTDLRLPEGYALDRIFTDRDDYQVGEFYKVRRAEDNIVDIYYKAADSKYSVAYYFQDEKTGDFAENKAIRDENRTGITDSKVTVRDSDKKTDRAGYVLDESQKSGWEGTVTGNGNLVLKVYFKLQYNVTISGDSHVSGATVTNAKVDWNGSSTGSWNVAAGYSVAEVTVNGKAAAVSENKLEVKKIQEDTKIVVTTKANTDTKYSVAYYYQQADGKFAEDTAIRDESRTGTTGNKVTVNEADKKTERANYVLDESQKSGWEGTITGNGNLVLKVYFKLQYNVTISGDSHVSGAKVSDAKVDWNGSSSGSWNVAAGYSIAEVTVNGKAAAADRASLEVTGIREDTVIYVSTKVNKYKLNVHYQYEDGTPAFAEDTNLTVEYGVPYSVATPDITGYTPDIPLVDGIMPAHDVSVTVIYRINEHTVIYMIDGEQYGDTETYKYGETVSIRPEAMREGSTFSGWNLKDSFKMPDEDIIIRGTFKSNSYIVTYLVDESPYGDAEIYIYGEDVTVRAVPSKEGYTFSGWDRTGTFKMPAENVTIRGTFKVNSYKVTYKVDGETYGETEIYEYNELVTVRPDPSKSGYTFSGWDTTGTFNMPAKDIVIEGTFTKKSSGGGDGGNNGGNTPKPDGPYVPEGPGSQDEPTITIDPNAVPLANAPAEGNPVDNLILIDDGNVPLAGLPKTGDHAGAHAGLAAILSGFLLAAFAILNNKKKEEEK